MNVNCVRVEVNCIKNDNCQDPVIEPEYFGYDFLVNEESLAKYIAFINQTMIHYGIPVLSINAVEHLTVPVKDVFDYTRIVETVQKSKNELLSEITDSPKRN